MDTHTFLDALADLRCIPGDDLERVRNFASGLTDAERAALASELAALDARLEEVEREGAALAGEMDAFVREWEHRAKHEDLAERERASAAEERKTLQTLLPDDA